MIWAVNHILQPSINTVRLKLEMGDGWTIGLGASLDRGYHNGFSFRPVHQSDSDTMTITVLDVMHDYQPVCLPEVGIVLDDASLERRIEFLTLHEVHHSEQLFLKCRPKPRHETS